MSGSRPSPRAANLARAVGVGLSLLALSYVSPGAAEDPAPSTPATPAAPTNVGNRVLQFQYTPVSNAQIAMWIEDDAGKFLATVALTEAVATRGIGNRPGASQMNSGFRWPYGRREGVLPVWAHRRVTADGAQPFKRVIFQKRTSEGLASRTSEDFSRDDYFCLSFNNSNSKKDALDAVSCASVFNSDKGRYITAQDVQAAYSEPYEDVATHVGRMQPLSIDSLYPPRRDIKTCAPTCDEHADVASFADGARAVMPDIDAVSMATPQGGQQQQRLYAVPSDWADGSYRACIEINVEGDYNGHYNDSSFPTPTTPAPAWDTWATSFGYPYRGQPSVVYCTPFELNETGGMMFGTETPDGSVSSWDTAASSYGQLEGMDGMSDDPVNAPGSGADRLKEGADGYRFEVMVKPPVSCDGNTPPSAIDGLQLARFPNKLYANQYAAMTFKAASDDSAVFHYDVRVSTDPITDQDSFMRGMTAKSASTAADELRIPVTAGPGTEIRADLGGLVADTHYYVGVRAIDACAAAGPIAVAEITTPTRQFATVSPCFVATATYGTPMAAEIMSLRRFRDRHLANNPFGRMFVSAYWVVGPKLASFIRNSEPLRAVSRVLLTPLVAAARTLDE